MSGRLKDDARERKLRVTLLSTEWKASSNGDLTTINRELAIQMAKHPNVEVSVFLPQCSEEDKRDAESYNVKLVEPGKLPGLKPVFWLACVPDGHAMDCVVGHGVALGQQIPLIKNNPNYTHCKWIQVVHTAPEEIGMYKSISEGQQMQETEIKLCEMADQVITIGPKLTDAYRYQLRNQDVFNLTPSILTEFLDVQQASDERRTFCVLVIESGDSEDFYVKGYDIAVKAIANLKDKSYQLKFASKQRGKEDELADKLLQCGIGRGQLIICSFDENRETLANLFSVVDIAILPSKTEGFGLSALEAISAGLPVLVGGNSGIAEALREVPNGSQCIVDSEDPAEWARAIKAVHDKKRKVRLAEAKFLRGNYLQQCSWEEPCNFLVKKMYSLAFGVELNVKVDVDDLKPEEQNMQTGMLAIEFVRCQKVQQPKASATSAASGGVSDPQIEDLKALKEKTFLSIITNSFHSTKPQSIEEWNWFKEFAKEMRVTIIGVSEGSLVITVRCESLMILEELWTDYLSGRLDEVVQNCFVTEKILKELNLAELRLKTTMDKEEYNACKMFFEKDALRGGLSSEFHSTSSTSESPQKKEQWEKSEQKTKIMETVKLEGASSSEFHSISSTSESPQNQEELKKWKQKTKIVEKEKQKGTSPLTVEPTTGHGKELIEKEQRRKGMLPPHGSSTSDPEEKLEELRMNLKKQVTCSICLDTYTEPKIISCHHTFCCECLERHAIMNQRQGKFRCPECQVEISLPEGNRFDCLPNSFLHKSLLSVLQAESREGTSPSNVPFTSGHKKKWEVRHNTGKFQEEEGSSPPPPLSTTDLEEKLAKVCEEIKMLRMEGSSPPPVSTVEVELEELVKKLQKGRLEGSSPPPPLSTIDLEEKLAKVCEEIKMLRMEGTLPPPELLTADLEEELERIGLILQKEKGSSPPPVSINETATRLRQEHKKVKMKAPKSSIYNMSTTPDIDKIDNIVDIIEIMVRLRIPSKGLKTLDEMKSKVKETLQSLAKNSSRTAKEAYSVLTEAKKEDERKRAALLNFYERTDVCLQSMGGKVHALLEENIGNLEEKIAAHKQNLLKKEYIVLVAGQSGSGKSTLVNLILGEQLLPISILFSASTICELRYGDTPKVVIHFKDKGSGGTTKTVLLDKPSEAFEQTYLLQISKFIYSKTSRERSSDYKKIELFWPHNLLKENIVMVETPGIGESTIMDDKVNEYLLEASAIIYVIITPDIGMIWEGKLEEFAELARQVSLDKQRESSSNCTLFVLNKWGDVPPEETDETKDLIVRKLKRCSPSLGLESQIIFMSARDASEAQKLGVVTKEFAELMNGIMSMVLKSIGARLQIQWRWLDYLLARMAFHTKAFVRNSSEDRKNLIDRVMFLTDRFQSIERQRGTISKELQSYLENKTDYAVSELSRYLKSTEVIEQFSWWTLDDVPNTQESWDLTWNCIQKALMKRLQEKIEEWEENYQVFSDARASLIQYFQKRFSYVEGQIRTLESSVLAGDVASSGSDPLALDDLSFAEKVVIRVKGKLENWYKTRQYNKDKCAFMAKASQEYLYEAAKEQHLKSFVMEQLKLAQVCLKQVLDRIPQLIEEDKMLCQQLRVRNRSKREVEDFYKPLYKKSVQIRDEMALFGIKEVHTMDIVCDDLEWQDDALLGRGAFAAVYRGKLKIRGEDKPVDVAVKVWNELDEVTASGFLSEAEILGKLSHPYIAKFYGTALQKEGERLKAILVMELCKENLMRHIFRHESNKPGKSSTATAARNVIGWAKDIAGALEYIHRQGIVHRDLKLENILLSPENIAKVANVGVSKGAKAITGTMTGTPIYLAPEVIKSSLYDYKADIYSLGIMLWEMWYGERAHFDVDGNVPEFFERVVEGVRPTHVQGLKKPPAGLHDLMQRCWDEEPDNRPDARECYEKLTQFYQEV